jgi:hypothetical protein
MPAGQTGSLRMCDRWLRSARAQAIVALEEVFRGRQSRSEPHSRPRTVAPETNGCATRERALNPRERNCARRELSAIESANPGRRAEQHRFIPEASECRRTLDLAKGIEVNGIVPGDDGFVPLICPTCQNVFRVEIRASDHHAYFAWGCFRYFAGVRGTGLPSPRLRRDSLR